MLRMKLPAWGTSGALGGFDMGMRNLAGVAAFYRTQGALPKNAPCEACLIRINSPSRPRGIVGLPEISGDVTYAHALRAWGH
jgi:hypothetical protein